ncbi:hypothetical protein DAPPUDRAFT_322681 [Daphnia pulex]|uniref:Protein kinase domain-containing protein n=1 Tax=Daphnia pulex TaxID=6669 RepID=E9GWQ3_DAPPU|nr:hypothetical protein DAPPUDRAFT_322681 [Daphnia pulex]|eukprot:EFX76137.1 hypothetical protein DAPPUDRAFT_322681 [Daphnia pulex]
MQKYEKLERIGEGTYGTVFMAKNRENQGIVALKRVRLDDDAEIFAFSNRLGEKFNEATLRTALTHVIQNNEELAVAGGEMISKFTNGYLRAVFTRVPEELIMAMHDFLTFTSNLETVGKHIGLGDLMLCSVSFS